jgi:hypothetical protein
VKYFASLVKQALIIKANPRIKRVVFICAPIAARWRATAPSAPDSSCFPAKS